MESTSDIKNIYQEDTGILFTLGVFDGVHIGHRFLIEKLKQQARKRHLLSGAVTFDPLPQSILQPGANIFWLSELQNKVKALKQLEIDVIVVLSFTQALSRLSAHEFISFLVKNLKMRGIIIGPDFSLGRNHEGDAQTLQLLGLQMAFNVEVVTPLTLNGETVSSTLIRRELDLGDMIKVQKLLGRRFTLNAKVVPGDSRGRLMGFPTANLTIAQGQALPACGVYLTNTYIHRKCLSSATYIGSRPTFNGFNKTVETYILDYKGSLYGENIEISFIRRLRDEKRFRSPHELASQIGKDIEEIRNIASDSQLSERYFPS
jgi:riboflavin kinase / FMN adenylyltransferase